MRLRRAIIRLAWTAAIAVLVVIGFAGCCGVRGAREDHYALWMGVLKPFGGDVYYVGSEGDYSYFRGGFLSMDRYKDKTSKLFLPRTFPLGKEKRFRVTLEMVPE
jgi:hypothetical protein